jgi:uncharacterized OB-fold protein
MSEENKPEEKTLVEGFESPISLRYTFAAGRATSKFLKEIRQGRLVGQRSRITGKVTVPPRGACPESGTPTEDEVLLPDTGTIITFTIVHIPIPNSPVKPPFIVANIVLDGADQTFGHLVAECKNEDVKIGTRVKAVWRDKSEWGYSLENIKYFVPLDEPPVDIEELEKQRWKETEQYRHA